MPLEATPVATVALPVFPEEELPEDKDTTPLLPNVPAVAALLDCKTKAPLLPV